MATMWAGTNLAQAHPGHGIFDQGATHALTSLSHLGLVGVIGFALLGFSWLARRPGARLALRVAGAAMACGAALRWFVVA